MELTKTAVIKLADIIPSKYNPRVKLTPKDQEYKSLDSSVQENGLVLPLIVNIRDMGLVGGHQRLSVLLASGETETRAVIIQQEMSGEQPESIAKKEDTSDGIKVLVGEFKFTISEIEFEDLMAEVREKVGFTKELVCDELKRRLFG